MEPQVEPVREPATRATGLPPVYPAGTHRQADTAHVRMKSPALATVLSAMPGLGQVYLGYYRQGFINILLVASLITVLNSGPGHAEPFFGIFLGFFWLFNMVDAARKANQYNQAIAGLGERIEDLPQPSKRDSLVAGVAIMALGLLLLANTRFGMSLDWLARWWPLLLILTGGYMVACFVLEQRKGDRHA